MSAILIRGGHVVDPSAGVDARRDLLLKDGRVADLQLAQSSGDTSLDRPAWGSITGSDPFPPLPTEFGGQSLTLRFTYYYLANNPDASDLQ